MAFVRYFEFTSLVWPIKIHDWQQMHERMYLNRKGVINFWLHGTYQSHKNDHIVFSFCDIETAEVPAIIVGELNCLR